MPKTLLAVDDSVSMRRVVEMTFAGEDLRITTVATAQEALAACRKDRPDVVLADVALEGFSGYDLCRAIKDEFSRIPVVLLASKQNPFDPARGQASGADEHIDKPYDTAKAIEVVKKVLTQGQSVAPRPIAAASQGQRAPMFAAQAPVIAPQPPPAPVVKAAPPPMGHPTMQGLPAARPQHPASSSPALAKNPTPALQRSITVKMPSEPAPPPSHAGAMPLSRQDAPALRSQQTVRMASDAPPAAEVSAQNGAAALPPELSGKLRQLGLTPAQVEGVLALSREVVEQVVWEVVPILAETMIREELSRLTKE